MTPIEALLPALRRLDAFLEAATRDAAGSGPLALADEPPSRLVRAGDLLGLDAFELDVLLLAVAPELDLRYGRLFARLQGDLLSPRPSAGLALQLLCSGDGERLARRSQLGPAGALAAFELVHRIPRSGSESLPDALLEPDSRLVQHLLGDDTLDRRLETACTLVEPRFGSDVDDELVDLVGHLAVRHAVLLHGPPDAGAVEIAEGTAFRRSARLLVLAAHTLEGADAERAALLAGREAALQRALLCVDGVDALTGEQLRRIARALTRVRVPVIVVASSAHVVDDLAPLPVTPVDLRSPDLRVRIRRWERALEHVPDDVDLAALASRFRLAPAALERAVADAEARARVRAARGGDGLLHGDDLFAGARARSGRELSRLARKIEPVFGWEDIVLPEDSRAQLRELCDRVAYRDVVVDAYGFRRSLGVGLGVSALFAGSSGTGKTMAAGVIANELGLDLFAIDLAGVVSKYIGETSKNLDRIFRVADDANAILFFDEADALFGKRSEVRDAHDRYANVEIAYLLQKMEAYDGVAILATNLRQNLDEAFARRLGFTVHFPFPSADDRRAIWERVWPPEVPLAVDVDLDELAERFRLSGGNIRNAALAATYIAVAEDEPVSRDHLLQAIRREYQKLGRGLSDEELDRGQAGQIEAIA